MICAIKHERNNECVHGYFGGTPHRGVCDACSEGRFTPKKSKVSGMPCKGCSLTAEQKEQMAQMKKQRESQ